MAKKTDARTALLKEILVELRRLNANLEKRTVPQEILQEKPVDDSDEMDDFE